MDRLLYGSLSAMRSAMARQATVANNLANANTSGFRAEVAATRPLWVQGQGLPSRALASEEVMAADMKAGAAAHTGRDLDVALNGDALLTVQAPGGEEAYSRRGDLQLADSGLLTDGTGAPVLGESGPITLPPADKVMIAADGTISIIPTGGDPALPQEVDKLKLVSPQGSKIAKGLDGLFRVHGGGALPSDPDASLESGSLEGSNVNVSEALIQMIEASRGWDTQVRMMATAREMDTSAADLMKLPD
jgi:flagellar basal-body rod protein FlgF